MNKFLVVFMMLFAGSVSSEEQQHSSEYILLKTFFPIEMDSYRRTNLRDYDDPRLGASVTMLRRTLRHVEELTVYLYNMGIMDITEKDIEASFIDAIRNIRSSKKIPIADDGYFNLQDDNECKFPVYFALHNYTTEELARELPNMPSEKLSQISGHTFVLVGKLDKNFYKARFTFSGKKPENYEDRYSLKNPLGMALYFMKNMGDC